MKLPAIAVIVSMALASIAETSDDPVQSRWRPDDLRIDGVMTDWPGQTFVSKEVSTSVVNDATDLYILVATSDPAVKLQLNRAGLTVYLDPKGGKAESFGVRIPPLGSRLSAGGGASSGDNEPMLLSYFDVIGPGEEDMRRVELAESPGIDLRIGAHEATYFVELKVPFTSGDGRPYAPGINIAKGMAGLGIVTPDPLRVARPGRGGRGGRGGLSSAMGGPDPPKGKALNIWTKVLLAKTR